jgi:hypothetical protein
MDRDSIGSVVALVVKSITMEEEGRSKTLGDASIVSFRGIFGV